VVILSGPQTYGQGEEDAGEEAGVAHRTTHRV
jgi:hypothetical protein